ncbi:MAG: MATE family efflux transporter [Lachnospiraceae bacterium]|nr:MATE family efflux transporter [Lachnospiraceae bacterium]
MNVFVRTIKDKEFLSHAFSIILPVALQLLITTVTNMVDTMMIGSLGTATISAVGLANKFFFVFALLMFGINSGSGVLNAQFFGNRDFYHIRKTFGLCAIIALVAASGFLSFAFFNPAGVMHIFTDSEEATEIGCRYLKTVCFTYPLFGLTTLLVMVLRSMKKVRVPVVTSLISVTINIFLNYTLIFGHFGAPALGVRGAALATIIARAVELSALIFYAFVKNRELRGRLSDFIGWEKSFLKSFVRNSVPVIANELFWGLGTTLYFVAYGHMGDAAVAAVTISATFTDILCTVGNGMSSATSVILGNEMGAGNLEKADDYGKKLIALAVMLSVVCGTIFLILRGPLLNLYDVAPEVRANAKTCMTIFTMYIPPIYVNLVIVVGILRAGGDTRMCFLIDTSGVWLLAVPIAFLGSLVWHLPITVVYAMVTFEEVYKCTMALLRYRKKKWLKNLAVEV